MRKIWTENVDVMCGPKFNGFLREKIDMKITNQF